MPRISVLLATHNGMPYLPETLASLFQQDEADFEIIFVDDGSTDATSDILASQHDSRLRIIRHAEKQGLAASLNEAAAHAQGEFLARMDADDIAEPTRLRKQADFLEAHPDISVLGTAAHIINAQGIVQKQYPVFTEHLLIKWRALFANPLIHPSVMMRREVLLHMPYDTHFPNSQDYDLWSRLLFTTKIRFANIAEPLLRYRIHDSSLTASKQKKKELSFGVMLRNLRAYISLTPQEEISLRTNRFNFRIHFSQVVLIWHIYTRAYRAFLQKEQPGMPLQKEIRHELWHMRKALVISYLRSFRRPRPS